MNFVDTVQNLCDHAIGLCRFKKNKKIFFLPMRRKENRVNTKHGFVIGRTNLKTGRITIDIFTPKFRKPKNIASILRIIAHEIAHHQKLPFKQFYKGKFIIRRHYPLFYKQVNKNIFMFKKDKILKKFFYKYPFIENRG